MPMFMSVDLYLDSPYVFMGYYFIKHGTVLLCPCKVDFQETYYIRMCFPCQALYWGHMFRWCGQGSSGLVSAYCGHGRGFQYLMTPRPLATLQPELTEATEGGQRWGNKDGKQHRNAQRRLFTRRYPQGRKILDKWDKRCMSEDGYYHTTWGNLRILRARYKSVFTASCLYKFRHLKFTF